MLIAQISDLHIPRKNTKTYGIGQMAENLVLCIDHINQHPPKPRLFMVTGDITYTRQAEEFNHAANLLNRFEMPFLSFPGITATETCFDQLLGNKLVLSNMRKTLTM